MIYIIGYLIAGFIVAVIGDKYYEGLPKQQLGMFFVLWWAILAVWLVYGIYKTIGAIGWIIAWIINR